MPAETTRSFPVSPGRVTLVGAGPGDPELITLAGVRALASADLVIYDRLVNPELLTHAPRAEHILIGKTPGEPHHLTQARINTLLVEQARAGRHVVRLKGGDPFIFGRGGEEVQAARAAGIKVHVIPGVTAALGAAAQAGVPLTHRTVSTSVSLITGCTAAGSTGEPDWVPLARGNGTLVFYMAAGEIPTIARTLLSVGRSGDEPAVVVHNASRPGQWIWHTVLEGLAMAERPIPAPALLIVGPVCRVARELDQLISEPHAAI